ncbi:MAG: hypothetical protein K2X09_05960, partial [Rickettsiales bacterium]|nr:hypothetical protein [Rickettsiales bacterium]
MTDREITAQSHPKLYADIQAAKKAIHARYPQYDAVVNKTKFFVTDDLTLNNNLKANIGNAPSIQIGRGAALNIQGAAMRGVIAHELAHIIFRDNKNLPYEVQKALECRADFFSEQVLPNEVLCYLKTIHNFIDDGIDTVFNMLNQNNH